MRESHLFDSLAILMPSRSADSLVRGGHSSSAKMAWLDSAFVTYPLHDGQRRHDQHPRGQLRPLRFGQYYQPGPFDLGHPPL